MREVGAPNAAGVGQVSGEKRTERSAKRTMCSMPTLAIRESRCVRNGTRPSAASVWVPKKSAGGAGFLGHRPGSRRRYFWSCIPPSEILCATGLGRSGSALVRSRDVGPSVSWVRPASDSGGSEEAGRTIRRAPIQHYVSHCMCFGWSCVSSQRPCSPPSPARRACR